jgi:hypothetical protein
MLGSGQTEKGETGEDQGQGMLIIFFNNKELFTKNSHWKAKQSVPHT